MEQFLEGPETPYGSDIKLQVTPETFELLRIFLVLMVQEFSI